MLTKEQNELLTRTDRGTPMGELMRRYWIPVLLSEELPARDGAPVQVKIMGEELVAFRDSLGRIGLLDEHCNRRVRVSALQAIHQLQQRANQRCDIAERFVDDGDPLMAMAARSLHDGAVLDAGLDLASAADLYKRD